MKTSIAFLFEILFQSFVSLCILAALIAMILSTPIGLELTIKHINRLIPEIIQIQAPLGRLYDGYSAKTLQIQSKNWAFQCQKLAFHWQFTTNAPWSIPIKGSCTVAILNIDNQPPTQLHQIQIEGSIQPLQIKNSQFNVKTQIESTLLKTPVQANLQYYHQEWQAGLETSDSFLTLKGNLVHGFEIKGNVFYQQSETVQISISPEIRAQRTSKGLILSGEILIPKASIKVPSFTQSKSLSPDIVMVNQPQQNNTPTFPITANLQIITGKEVWLEAGGMSGYLDGAVQLTQLPNEMLHANGSLSLREGQFKAYGQDLKIEQGEILYTGGLLDNPYIKIRAIRKFSKNNNTNTSQLLNFTGNDSTAFKYSGAITVGIDVSGFLLAPKTTLFSIPSTLSQADTLAMLLLGKPANQADQAGGEILFKAVSAMNIGSGTQGLRLINQLKQALGVDITFTSSPVNNTQTGSTVDQKSLTIGKNLFKHLYFSYNYALAQNTNSLIALKYLLTPFLTLQITATHASSGMDLLYTSRN